MITANPLLGAGLHAVGATAAALCYTPQQKLRGWSWQTYWFSQALICWFTAPIIGAIVTIPNLSRVLAEAPTQAMLVTFLLGVAYGIGGVAMREWSQCRPRTKVAILAALTVLIAAVLMLTYGNYIAEHAAPH